MIQAALEPQNKDEYLQRLIGDPCPSIDSFRDQIAIKTLLNILQVGIFNAMRILGLSLLFLALQSSLRVG